MKVILTAFGGQLRSEPMDWPDNVGPRINMAMDLDGSLFFDTNGREVLNVPSTRGYGTFEYTGRGEFLRGGGSARIYRLVGFR